ncbi:MAG TPA: fatty acyl-AMP ligase [Stellaceae bacterium]|jgi:acyl-CoA synthetase (AMP-forming)/AMP-acid ligase II|nr:fatty acyl-AMP ligase [Stellaceae bacterium]
MPQWGSAGAAASLIDWLHRHAASRADQRAYVVLSDRGREEEGVTFAELARRAIAMAPRIAARAEPGDRALLLCPNGIDFMTAFLGCLMARIIAVPMMQPRRQTTRDASASIVADCAPRLALAPAALIGGAPGNLPSRIAAAGLEWLAVDASESRAEGEMRAPLRDDIAFLQYTSGSTSAPKGVTVSHANLLANLAMIETAFGNTARSTYVSWVPLYHDMGLIINALQSLYLGALCVFMAPVGFMQRPLVWLRAISDYKAEIAGGPNFAFDLCVERYRSDQMVGVDLSGWKLAFNGAEPVHAETIRRFSETFTPHGFAAGAMYPAYGMAEATVLISAGRRGAGVTVQSVSRDALRRNTADAPDGGLPGAGESTRVVGCGRALEGERLAVVDPETRQRLTTGQVGEIWATGPHVAQGYWRNPEASAAAFGATIIGEPGDMWLRTGDLGFLDDDGELYVTGRMKDVIIIRGANHYPQDIEDTVQNCHPGLRRHGGAAFAIAGADASERLVVIQEVARTYRNRIDVGELTGRIREAIVSEHEIAPFEIALLRPGALPQTTSGKIQRSLSRELWVSGALERL